MAVSRRTLLERIDRFIGSMERVNREPDEWQGQCVAQALADIIQGDLSHAEEMMIQAKTPPELRLAGPLPGSSAGAVAPRAMELRAHLQTLKDAAAA